jgi:hypothetical protein
VSTAASNNSGLERLIAQVRSAEQAGVFSRTPVDVVALLDRPVASRPVRRLYEWTLVGLPLAACLAIVVGMTAMFAGSDGVSRMAAPMATHPASTPGMPLSPEAILECVTGPGMQVSPECSAADLDHDGDVDLLDYSSFQRLVATNI